jgi:hypothetical protein
VHLLVLHLLADSFILKSFIVLAVLGLTHIPLYLFLFVHPDFNVGVINQFFFCYLVPFPYIVFVCMVWFPFCFLTPSVMIWLPPCPLLDWSIPFLYCEKIFTVLVHNTERSYQNFEHSYCNMSFITYEAFFYHKHGVCFSLQFNLPYFI